MAGSYGGAARRMKAAWLCYSSVCWLIAGLRVAAGGVAES